MPSYPRSESRSCSLNDSKGEMSKRELLAENGFYISTPSGRSMRPMLRGERDNILVEPCEGRLCRLDVVLYERGDGTHVLHRIVRVRERDYLIRGDNCDYTERGITDERILGRLVGFWRGEKYIPCTSRAYRLYARLWCFLYPLRFLRLRAFRLLRAFLVRTPLRALWHRIKGKKRK